MHQFRLILTVAVSLSIAVAYGQTLTLSPTAIKGPQANTSGLSFKNLNSNSPAGASNGKNLSVDAAGNVILTAEGAGAPTSYWQLTVNDLVNTNSGVTKVNNLQVGSSTIAVAGAIRFTGTNFEGYNGTKWVSLTGVVTYTYAYIPAIQAAGGGAYISPCQITCDAAGGIPFTESPNNYSCRSQGGDSGNFIAVSVFTGYTCYRNDVNLGTLALCYCRFPK